MRTLFFSIPPLLYNPDPRRIKGSSRPSLACWRTQSSISLWINCIPSRQASHVQRRRQAAPPASFPPSLPPTLGLISHGCSFNNPFLPPQRAPQGCRTEFGKGSVSFSLAVKETLGNPLKEPCPNQDSASAPSPAIKIAAISISFISGERGGDGREHLLLSHSGIFSARPTRTRNFPNSFDSLL